jgi:hypothetical protein
MKIEFSRTSIEKHSSIKFYENPPFGSRVVPRGRTDGRTDRQTYMTKLIVAFRNFANAPKKPCCCNYSTLAWLSGWMLTCVTEEDQIRLESPDVSEISRYAVSITHHTWYGKLRKLWVSRLKWNLKYLTNLPVFTCSTCHFSVHSDMFCLNTFTCDIQLKIGWGKVKLSQQLQA